MTRPDGNISRSSGTGNVGDELLGQRPEVLGELGVLGMRVLLAFRRDRYNVRIPAASISLEAEQERKAGGPDVVRAKGAVKRLDGTLLGRRESAICIAQQAVLPETRLDDCKELSDALRAETRDLLPGCAEDEIMSG